MKIIKAYVGVSMDGFVAGKSICNIIRDIKELRKIPVIFFMGCGWILSKK
jgi:hypothetical protein